ncbi:MAG: hypothetical protein ACE5QV_02155 [Fidelibacterota bacterium]
MEDKEVMRFKNVAEYFISKNKKKEIDYLTLMHWFDKHEKYEEIFEYKDKMWVFLRHLKKKGYKYNPHKMDHYRYPHSEDIEKIWDSIKIKDSEKYERQHIKIVAEKYERIGPGEYKVIKGETKLVRMSNSEEWAKQKEKEGYRVFTTVYYK